jgi:hypothetical protein
VKREKAKKWNSESFKSEKGKKNPAGTPAIGRWMRNGGE